MIASLYALELLRFVTVSWYSIKAAWFSIQAAWYSLELLGITLKLQGIPPINIRFGFVALSGFLFCKLHTLVTLRGQKSKKNGYLRIQGRMQIFERKVPEGFKSRFDTVER